MVEAAFEGVHARLRGGGDCRRSSVAEYGRVYYAIYSACTPPHNATQKMYAKYVNYVNTHARTVVLPEIERQHGVAQLRALVKGWADHGIACRYMTGLFVYVSQHLAAADRPLSEAHTAAFRAVYMHVRENVAATMRAEFRRDREGHQVDKALLRDATALLSAMATSCRDAYGQDFEGELVAETGRHYAARAEEWVTQHKLLEYCRLAGEAMDADGVRARTYLRPSSVAELRGAAEAALLGPTAAPLVGELEALLRARDAGRARVVVDTFCRTAPGLEAVCAIVHRTILEEGKAAMGSPRPVEAFMAMYTLYSVDWYASLFGSMGAVNTAMKRAFTELCEATLNDKPFAAVAADHVDSLLRRGSLPEAQAEAAVDAVVSLTGCMGDKDVFVACSRRAMCHRLLRGKSAGDHLERHFVSKLKYEHGASMTTHMESMLVDMHMSGERAVAFEEWVDARGGSAVAVSVRVLTTGAWPALPQLAITQAPEIAAGMEAFREYYAHATGGSRKLTWLHTTSTCTLQWADLVELELTTAQASVLLLFNDAPELTAAEVTAALAAQPAEAEWLLASLTKASLLTVAAGAYRVNAAYAPRGRRVVVPLPPLPRAENRMMQEVEANRKHDMEATIIRIMKAKRSLPYGELVATAQSQLASRFVASTKGVKKRVEDLIAREFMERDRADGTRLVYVA